MCVQHAGGIFWKLSLCQFVDKGRKLYTDRRSWSGSYVHTLCHDSFLFLLYWACNFLVYSSTFPISVCTIVLPQQSSRMSTFSHCPCRLVTRHSLPRIVEPNIYWCLRLYMASSLACLIGHYCPDLCACTTCLLFSRVSECELEAFLCNLIQLHWEFVECIVQS